MSLMAKWEELEPKQKVTAILLIIISMVLIYLIYDTLFAGDDFSVSTPVSKPSQPTQPAIKSTTVAPVEPKQPENKSVTYVPDAPLQQATAERLEILKASEKLQNEYLKILNEYQIAQLQAKLEDTNSKIAAAKLKTTQVQSQTKKLEIAVQATDSTMSTTHNSVKKQLNIQVAYVGQKNGRWIAMLKIDNNYFEVKVGTELPDSSVVDVINQEGVVIEKNGEKQFFRVPKSLD